MSEYRKIHLPKCPYCGYEVPCAIGNYNYSRLASMAMGSISEDLILKCDRCGKDYRATCSIRFSARRLK